MLHETLAHRVGAETLATTITRPHGQPETAPTILLLHGAGASNRQRSAPLAEALAARGHTSLRFDHSGHGESTGKLEASSLAKRLSEAQSFLPLLHPTAPLTVLGSSMGGHTACQLLGHANIQTLIAQVPAAYTAAAENVTFGDAFTTLIRQPESWRDAVIWPGLEAFTGTFLLISGGLDTVIPQGVLRAYWHHTRHTRQRTHLYLPAAEHAFTQWLDAHPGNRQAYTNTILNLLPH